MRLDMSQPIYTTSKLGMEDLKQAHAAAMANKNKWLQEKKIWFVGVYQNLDREDCVLQKVLKMHLTMEQAEALTVQLNEQAGCVSETGGVSFSLPKPDSIYHMYDIWEQWDGQHVS